ncbi:hypothetical protein E4191_18950 (plasmid) [Paracoccus liaowanqingii]|uniref:Uncharacterized protein n=1 Tax=Paracoccus liaowanqingii TaxID=2560053 RepID=A0A4Y5STV0_9RHOB|nr:hypothetical protein [Paracoccus liaowanqingii]QDA36205.1 hypothetical protein E4191_18950 [Paracoccus liaowanqingii]
MQKWSRTLYLNIDAWEKADMVKYMLAVSVTMIIAASAQAGCVGTVVAGQCAEALADSPYLAMSRHEISGYQGSSGFVYRDDLNSPSELNGNRIDLAAKRRDAQGLDIGGTQDQDLDQYSDTIFGNQGTPLSTASCSSSTEMERRRETQASFWALASFHKCWPRPEQ